MARARAIPKDIRITHPDKVLFPGNGWTKADVIRYYWAVAPVLLPHLRGRPVTMIRWPNGVRGEHFFEKDAPRFTPSWVPIGPVDRTDEDRPPIRYILINDARTLLWVANLASIEVHPFLHRYPKIDAPTQIAFDLDPGEGAGLMECIEVAFLIWESLEALGLKSWPKVSGSKGIQLYVPLNTAAKYAQTTPFAHALAERLEREHPKLVVADMPKLIRRGKVLVDWSQNHAKKTTVGVYSLRAKRDVPFVSAPVMWEELERAQKRRDADILFFPPDAAIERVERLGDLFAPVATLKQKLPRDAAEQIGSGGSARPRRPHSGAGGPAVRPRPSAGKAPEFVPPMVPRLVAELPEGREWLYEVKWDGYRIEALKHGEEVRLLSRRGNDLTADYPAVAEALRKIPAHSVLTDGEVVALDDEGRPSFQLLQHRSSGRGSIVDYVFDLLELEGKSCRAQPLEERKAKLASLVEGTGLRFSAALMGAPGRILEQIRRLGLEGVVAKRRGSPYQPGERSADWVKVKLSPEQEFVIGGYKPGGPVESLVVGHYEGRKLVCAGKVRQGLNPWNRKELGRRLARLETDRCPFANLPNSKKGRWGEGITAEQMKELVWTRPELVAQIRFTEWTLGGNLRHGEYLGMREDKPPREVLREGG
jgi:bifunctional non-homologous end joining protein LigD